MGMGGMGMGSMGMGGMGMGGMVSTLRHPVKRPFIS
jgi:hypothetical protein